MKMRWISILLVLMVSLAAVTGSGEALILEEPVIVSREAHEADGPILVGPLYVVEGEEHTYTIVNRTPDDGYVYCMYERGDQAPSGGYYLVNGVTLSPDENGSLAFTFPAAGTFILTMMYNGNIMDSIWITAVEATAQLRAKVMEIADQCRDEGMTDDWDIALWLHDWLTHHAYYDLTLEEHSPEGVLIKGFGVCESYSMAYQMLLNEFGIPCHNQTGGGHAWNVVLLDGEWCAIDVTWDDPTSQTEEENNVAVSGHERYLYFGLTDSILGVDHEYYITYPCNTLANSYLVRKGLPEAYYHDVLYGNYSGFDKTGRGLIEQAAEGLTEISVDVSAGYRTHWVEYASGGMSIGNLSTYKAHIIFSVMEYLLDRMPLEGPDGEDVYYDFTYDADAGLISGVKVNTTVDAQFIPVLSSDLLTVGETAAVSYTLAGGTYPATAAPEWKVYCDGAQEASLSGVLTADNGSFAFTVPSCGSLTVTVEIAGLNVGSAGPAAVLEGGGVLLLPADLDSIEDGAFEAVDAERVIVPFGCSAIGSGVFAQSAVHVIDLPSSLTDIADGAFNGIEGLIIRAPSGSYALSWADSMGFTVIPTGE